MAFPITISGVVKVSFSPEQSVQEYISAVERGLESEKARQIKVVGNRISFRGGMFRFVSTENLLISIGSGEIQVNLFQNELYVKYKVSLWSIFLVASTSFLFFVYALHGTTSTIKDVSYFVVLWLWIIGGNYLWTIFRFRRFLKNIKTMKRQETAIKEVEFNEIRDMDDERAKL